jgi:hypothetical protein
MPKSFFVQAPVLLAASMFLNAWPSSGRADDSPIFFHVGFDGKSAATLNGATVQPTREAATAFEGTGEQGALTLGQGTTIEFDLGEGFPSEAGSIEVRFKPNFPQQPDQQGRLLFSLVSPDNTGVNFGFDSKGTRWQFGVNYPKWQRKVSAWYFDKRHEQRWTSLVLTWETSPTPLLRLYRDGKLDRSRTERYTHSFAGLRRLIIGGAEDVRTSIDEIVIYRQALSPSDVTVLHSSYGQPHRMAALSRKRAEEERAAKAQADARRTQIAALKGKVACIINPRGSPQRNFNLPGGIVATGLRVEDIGQVDLNQFAVIYGPPGGGYQVTKEQSEIMRHYVQSGGGYVGVCAGANYAGKAGLLKMATHSLKNQGLVTVGIKPHPITEGFSGEVVIHHGNGPIMVPGEGCNVVGTFQIGQNFPITTAAIVAGDNGKGRAVAFGPHPTGGGVEFEGKGAKFEGDQLGTEKLLINALLWAAKITGNPAPAPQ